MQTKQPGLRYFITEGQAFPELSWTRDTGKKLLQAVEPGINKRPKPTGKTQEEPSNSI